MTISSKTPSLVFIPGSWHKPLCYQNVIEPLEQKYNIRCRQVTLPSTQDDPQATFKDDLDAARKVILSEMTSGHDVIVIAHSYGGMIGNSSIKGLTKPQWTNSSAMSSSQDEGKGHVVGLVLIASGFTITGLSLMDPLFGIPPPAWRVNKETGYAEIIVDPRLLFYHDVPKDEGNYWVSQLTTQSLKSLFEGGEHAYSGWKDTPTWYIGTIEDQGLPVFVQRIQIGMARAQGATVHHVELQSGHSPFLSMSNEVVDIILEIIEVTGRKEEQTTKKDDWRMYKKHCMPMASLNNPLSWFKFGLPLLFGNLLGWSYMGFMGMKRLFFRGR